MAAASTMLRMVNLLIALSFGVHREQLEHLIGLTWPRPFLLRPLQENQSPVIYGILIGGFVLGRSLFDHFRGIELRRSSTVDSLNGLCACFFHECRVAADVQLCRSSLVLRIWWAWQKARMTFLANERGSAEFAELFLRFGALLFTRVVWPLLSLNRISFGIWP